MDSATITAIAALVSAVAGAIGGNLVAGWRTRRELARGDRISDAEAAAGLRDDMAEQLRDLRSEVGRQREEIDHLRRGAAECDRRCLHQAEDIARMRIALREAGIEVPPELPLSGRQAK